MGLIYMRTSPSGKSYIGLTTQSEECRWRQHCGEAKNPNADEYHSKLSSAIRKYGADNFSVQILEECADKKLPKREIYWIKYYNTYNDGYNSTLGGEGFWKYETEDMLNLWHQGYNKKEIADIIGCNEKTVRNHLCPIISKEEGYLRGQTRKRNECDRDLILELWHKGLSIIQIGESISTTSIPTISKILKNNGITDTEIQNRARERRIKGKSKPLVRYDIDGNIIAEYSSIKQACKELNITQPTLKNIINKTSKKYCNIILEFKEDK